MGFGKIIWFLGSVHKVRRTPVFFTSIHTVFFPQFSFCYFQNVLAMSLRFVSFHSLLHCNPDSLPFGSKWNQLQWLVQAFENENSPLIKAFYADIMFNIWACKNYSKCRDEIGWRNTHTVRTTRKVFVCSNKFCVSLEKHEKVLLRLFSLPLLYAHINNISCQHAIRMATASLSCLCLYFFMFCYSCFCCFCWWRFILSLFYHYDV